MSEGAPKGTVVAVVTAAALNQTVVYSIVAGNEEGECNSYNLKNNKLIWTFRSCGYGEAGDLQGICGGVELRLGKELSARGGEIPPRLGKQEEIPGRNLERDFV